MYHKHGRCLDAVVVATPDSGAESSVKGTEAIESLGVSSEVIPLSVPIHAKAANGINMVVTGTFTARVNFM